NPRLRQIQRLQCGDRGQLCQIRVSHPARTQIDPRDLARLIASRRTTRMRNPVRIRARQETGKAQDDQNQRVACGADGLAVCPKTMLPHNLVAFRAFGDDSASKIIRQSGSAALRSENAGTVTVVWYRFSSFRPGIVLSTAIPASVIPAESRL